MSSASRTGSRSPGLRRRERWFRGAADVLDAGVALYRAGSVHYRNRALRRLLARDEGRAAIQEEIAACAERLRRRLRQGVATAELEECRACLATGRNRYRIVAKLLEGGGDGRPTAMAVVVQPAVPLLPDGAELMDRYGLTERESEVAVLLARGSSNRRIADRLEISEHTARHHAQRVLRKVGAKNRKAFALRLLRDRD